MPLVSVIIPTYNRLPFLKEAIDSVLSQTVQDFELIIIDDGSTDNTKNRLIKYDERVFYYCLEHAGVSAARNAGVQRAQGEWISFLDSDDLWKRKKLEEELNAMKAHPRMRCCYTNEIWLRNNVRVNQKHRHKKFGGWIFEACLSLCIISSSSVMMHRSLFDKIGYFDETMPVCEDYDLWLRLTLIYPVYYIKKPLIIKRGGHDNQLSKKFWGIDRFRIQALEKILRHPDITPEKKEMVKNELVKKCTIVAQGALKRNRPYEGCLYQSKAYMYSL